ncbi:uncharacterized protein LOC117295846 [Asterias rubens]|uniref:uncharacterized protein LOC117295846 n=1 Tax=Asterias rubens TaxID=7604 RepID=UPI001455081B|nr:uncharacterized protein LOC117295846 [Asterias rubens]
MSSRGQTSLLVTVILMVLLQCFQAAPLAEGSGSQVPQLVSGGVALSPRWSEIVIDQEGSGGESEASQFSSTSDILSQSSSLEPSSEVLSSSDTAEAYGTSSEGDSDFVIEESGVDNEESILIQTTTIWQELDDNDFDLDGGAGNEVGQEGGEEPGTDQEEGDNVDNEIMNVTPTEAETTTSVDDNAIPGGVRNSPIESGEQESNNLNIISNVLGNEVGDHEGRVKGGVGTPNEPNETSESSGIPGSGVMAVVMFAAAIGVGALISFIMFSVSRFFKKTTSRNNDPK